MGADEVHTSQPLRGVQLALATALISGVAVYVNGQAVRRFESATVYTTGKNLVAGILLTALAVTALQQRRGRDDVHVGGLPSRRRQGAVMLGVAALGGGVAFVLFFEGLARATSTDAAFLHKTLVIWASVLAVVVLHEHIGALQVAAVVMLLAGHIVLADGIGALRLGSGEAMILAATLLWSAEVVAVKWLLADVDPATMGAVRVGGGAVLLLGWLVVTDALGGLGSLTASQIGWLVVTGMLLTGFVTCWYAALARATVVDVTAILVVGAVVTGLIDVVVGHSPAGIRPPGWVLIVVGVAIVAIRGLVVGDARRRPIPMPS